MDEGVLAAVGRRDETKAFGGIEEFNGTVDHGSIFSCGPVPSGQAGVFPARNTRIGSKPFAKNQKVVPGPTSGGGKSQ